MTSKQCASCGALIQAVDELVALVRVAPRDADGCRLRQESVVAILHRRCWNELVQLRDYSRNSTLRDNILDGMEVV